MDTDYISSESNYARISSMELGSASTRGGLVSEFHSPFTSHKFKDDYAGDFFKKGQKMNLEAVEMLVFGRNTLAVKQKGNLPVVQLECDSGCENFMPEFVMCVNRGWMERMNWFDWGCAALMPKGYSFKEYSVHCVGDYPNSDIFVWIGSCILRFSLKTASTKKSTSKSMGTRMWCGIKNLSTVCKELDGNNTQARKSRSSRKCRFKMEENEYVDNGVIFDPSVYTFVTDNVSPLTEEEILENERIRREKKEYLSNLDYYTFGVQEHAAVKRPAVPEKRSAARVPHQQPKKIPVKTSSKEHEDEDMLEEDDSWIAGLLLVVIITLYYKFR